MAEPGAQVPLTPEERAAEKAAGREASLTVPEKSYDLAPGEYSGFIGQGPGREAGEGRVVVPSSGKYRTTDVGEQAFLEGLGYTGTLTRAGQKQAKQDEEQAEAQMTEEEG
jgi:hypothetical protein